MAAGVLSLAACRYNYYATPCAAPIDNLPPAVVDYPTAAPTDSPEAFHLTPNVDTGSTLNRNVIAAPDSNPITAEDPAPLNDGDASSNEALFESGYKPHPWEYEGCPSWYYFKAINQSLPLSFTNGWVCSYNNLKANISYNFTKADIYNGKVGPPFPPSAEIDIPTIKGTPEPSASASASASPSPSVEDDSEVCPKQLFIKPANKVLRLYADDAGAPSCVYLDVATDTFYPIARGDLPNIAPTCPSTLDIINGGPTFFLMISSPSSCGYKNVNNRWLTMDRQVEP